jgi:hypothetical protein
VVWSRRTDGFGTASTAQRIDPSCQALQQWGIRLSGSIARCTVGSSASADRREGERDGEGAGSS